MSTGGVGVERDPAVNKNNGDALTVLILCVFHDSCHIERLQLILGMYT